ncbi:C4-dicarboxylate TRAP transporter large permease protein DctM [subsurface metagenome]
MTGMIFVLLIGATMLGRFMAITDIPFELADYISGLSVSPYVVLVAVLILYILIGFVMDIMAMLLLVIPIFHPVLAGLGFDPVWLAVITIITVLMGHISPPVGIVVYALSGMVKDVPMFTIFRGALPFLGAMLVCLIILIAFPQIALFLPHLMRPG